MAVEIGHSVAAPFGGLILASLGATVLKVEAPGDGDDARTWGPPFWHGSAATFQALNRDKLTATVNLKDPGERDGLRRYVVEKADVVIQNLRPGLIERFGLDDRLVAEKPRLVYCNMAAFGRTGPLARKPGYDPLMQAFGGLMSVTGEEGRAPVRVGPSIIDMATGMWAVIGILAALRRREMTGEGGVVDTSLLETALAWMTVPAAQYLASGNVPKRIGSEAAMVAPYKAFAAADGYLVVAAGNDRLFARLCGAIGRPELATDPRFFDQRGAGHEPGRPERHHRGGDPHRGSGTLGFRGWRRPECLAHLSRIPPRSSPIRRLPRSGCFRAHRTTSSA